MSILNTQLAIATDVIAGGSIPLGEVVHKSGCHINAIPRAIIIKGKGYYKITAIASIAVSAVGNISLNIADNGTVIATASTTKGAVGDIANLTAQAIVFNNCQCNADHITFTISADGTVNEFDVIVEAI